VVRAVARLEERRGAPLPERFAALERRRLEEILTAWLELEKGREAFEVIQPEGEREGNVGGIHLAEAVEAFGYRFVGDEDVFLRLLGEREDERLVVSRGRAHNPRTQRQPREPLWVNMQEATGKLDVAREVRAQDDLGPAVRNQAVADIGLLCRGDDGLPVLAHFAREARWDAVLTVLVFGEHVVAFIKDEHVLQDLPRARIVLAQQE